MSCARAAWFGLPVDLRLELPLPLGEREEEMGAPVWSSVHPNTPYLSSLSELSAELVTRKREKNNRSVILPLGQGGDLYLREHGRTEVGFLGPEGQPR